MITDTPENRALIEKVANDKTCFLFIDKYGNNIYSKILPDGTQLWVEARGGTILHAGISPIERKLNENQIRQLRVVKTT